MRLIDADVAIKDAEINYSRVYDVPIMKYFLEKQPTVMTIGGDTEGCEACKNKYCMTCTYQLVDEWHEPCINCDNIHRNYKPTNYCCECGKRLVGID